MVITCLKPPLPGNFKSYSSTLIRNTSEIELKADGTRNDGSIRIIEDSLQVVPGFQSINIDPQLNKISFAYTPDVPEPKSFIIAIESTDTGNFETLIFVEGKSGRENLHREVTDYFYYSLGSFVHMVLLLSVSLVFMFVPPIKKLLDNTVVDFLTSGIIIRWATSTLLQIITFFQLCTASCSGLGFWSIDMDMLLALKANLIYFCSVYSVLRTDIFSDLQGMDFFGTSLNFVAFCLLGRYLDAFVRRKRSLVITQYKGIAAETAILENSDHNGNLTGKILDSGWAIQRADVMRLVLGARTVGELKQSCTNQNGVLQYKGTIVRSRSLLSRISQLVESGQMSESPVEEFASAISKLLMLLGIVFSIFVWLSWYLAGKFLRSPHPSDRSQLAAQVWISVIAIASSCSLPLATRIALLVATQVGACRGVLFKNGRALGRQRQVNCIVFKKRTLIAGKPLVVDIKLRENMKFQEFLQFVVAVEAKSRHPIAQVIMEYSQKYREDTENTQWQDAQDFVSIAGRGVKAIVQNKEILMGNKSLMVEHNVAIPDDTEKMLAENEWMAHTMVLVSIDQAVTGAREIISILKSMEVKTIMATCDERETATFIAGEVGIETVIAETKPEEMVEKIKNLQDQGYVVAMVDADRTNYYPLIAADVGIAIGADTGMAAEAADIVITSNNLEDVITAIDISNKTVVRNRLNSIFVAIHNLLGIPITATAPFLFGYAIPPWLAGTITSFSSLVVVMSSYLLKHYRRPNQLKTLQMNDIIVL